MFLLLSPLTVLLFIHIFELCPSRRIHPSTQRSLLSDGQLLMHAINESHYRLQTEDALKRSASADRRRLQSLTPESHRVKNLPGLKDTNIVHYAGHITVDPEKGGNLFYWLIEAQEVNPTTGR